MMDLTSKSRTWRGLWERLLQGRALGRFVRYPAHSPDEVVTKLRWGHLRDPQLRSDLMHEWLHFRALRLRQMIRLAHAEGDSSHAARIQGMLAPGELEVELNARLSLRDTVEQAEVLTAMIQSDSWTSPGSDDTV
jgi:hypothetical protein